jgi:hypothetical protein
VILDLEIYALSPRAPDGNELEVGAGYPFLLATIDHLPYIGSG